MAIMNVTKNVKNQFSNDKNLAMRINFYKKYTTNKYKFADWLFDKYVFKKNMKILELGCGNGSHWEGKIETLPDGCSLVLSDFSEGMLDLVREKFSANENVSIKKIDIQEIPFEDETFDIVIANHMLFHVPDLNKALLEVKRVLKDNGVFYSATDGLFPSVYIVHIVFIVLFVFQVFFRQVTFGIYSIYFIISIYSLRTFCEHCSQYFILLY